MYLLKVGLGLGGAKAPIGLTVVGLMNKEMTLLEIQMVVNGLRGDLRGDQVVVMGKDLVSLGEVEEVEEGVHYLIDQSLVIVEMVEAVVAVIRATVTIVILKKIKSLHVAILKEIIYMEYHQFDWQ
jgi:hypothetical protein